MDGQRTPLQDFETLYIGETEPAVVRRAFVGHVLVGLSWSAMSCRIKTWQVQDLADSRLGQIKTMRDCEGSLTTTMARIVFGDEFLGTGLMEQARG
jgi:hypothetical protein